MPCVAGTPSPPQNMQAHHQHGAAGVIQERGDGPILVLSQVLDVRILKNSASNGRQVEGAEIPFPGRALPYPLAGWRYGG